MIENGLATLTKSNEQLRTLKSNEKETIGDETNKTVHRSLERVESIKNLHKHADILERKKEFDGCSFP